jgi:hypothetical protein
MVIWNILLSFGTFYGHFGIFCGLLVCFSHFGMLYQEKSGNPGTKLASKFEIRGFSKTTVTLE